MVEIDPITGLPKELGAWESITKEAQKITVYIIKKKFGKKYTVVEGFDSKEIDTKQLLKKLKAKFACGGTSKDNMIELQGDHKNKVRDVLAEAGFQPESIEVKD